MKDLSDLIHDLTNKLTMVDGLLKMSKLRNTPIDQKSTEKLLEWNRQAIEILSQLKELSRKER